MAGRPEINNDQDMNKHHRHPREDLPETQPSGRQSHLHRRRPSLLPELQPVVRILLYDATIIRYSREDYRANSPDCCIKSMRTRSIADFNAARSRTKPRRNVRSTPKMRIDAPPRSAREGKFYPQVGSMTSDATPATITRPEFSGGAGDRQRPFSLNPSFFLVHCRRHITRASSVTRKTLPPATARPFGRRAAGTFV